MKKLTLNEQKSILFNILDKFATYCEQHNLRYYLYYGTLLGAVRHQNFIPWDDDIDIIMLREDYIKLHQLLQHEPFQENLKLISFELGNATNPYAKIIDTTTEVRGKTSNADRHLWIDIFPLDHFPTNHEIGYQQIRKISRLLLFQNAANSKIFSGSTITRALIKMPFAVYAHARGVNYYCKRMVGEAQKFSFSGYYANLVACDKNETPICQEDLDNPEQVYFYARYFKTVRNYDKYLKKQYGNYMELPPKHQRHGHMLESYKK